jgi:hypothetical protein
MSFKKIQHYIIWILFVLTLLRLFFGNAAFPLFNNVDEHAHFDTVVKYSAGNLPNPRNVKFDLESAKYIVLYGSPEYITRPENYTSKEMPLPNWKTLNDISQETLDAKFTEWTSTKNHEVFSPPIYYSIQGAWFSFGKLLGLDGGYLLYWLRFVNVFVFLGLFWITYIALRKIFPEDLVLQTSVLTLLAFFPQDVFYSINSDTFSPLPSNVGDRAVFVEGTINQASPVAYPTFITKTEQENVNRTFNADNPSRVFGVDIPNGLASGSSLVALNGDSLGIWSGSKIISNGIIKRAVDLYLSNNLVRPKFGFNYETLTVTKAKLLGLSEGIRVTLLTKSGPASQAGLKEGDIITKVGETQVINQPQFEQLLESYLPTQIVPLSIVRGQQSLIINLASQKLE